MSMKGYLPNTDLARVTNLEEFLKRFEIMLCFI
jgi:hypothetical protein